MPPLCRSWHRDDDLIAIRLDLDSDHLHSALLVHEAHEFTQSSARYGDRGSLTYF
jgi:hypothetical protein